MSSKIKVVLATVLVVGSISFCLAAGELFLWLKGWHTPPPSPPRCIYWDPKICALYQFYEPYGYRLKPSQEMEYFYPKVNPRRLRVKSNNHGFRSNRELEELDSRLRILVVGDSFVFGEGVEANERFSNVVEKIRPNWRVDNMGMTGWGADLMLRALVNVGLRQRIDVVVLSIYTDDFRRVHPFYVGVGFPNPRFVLKGEDIISVPYPTPQLWHKSRMFHMVRRSSWNATNTEWKINKAIFDQFYSLSQTAGFFPIIIFLPGTSDTANDRKRRIWLNEYAQGNEISFLDLTETIHQEPRERVFIKGNPHYNPFGHKKLAQALVQFLDKEFVGMVNVATRCSLAGNHENCI